MIKTRLQISGRKDARNYKVLGINGTVSVMVREEGLSSLWKGIGAAWLREGSYTSLRLGLYGPIKHAMGVKADSSFLLKFVAGSISGVIGSLAGNPFNVLKTRMMAFEGPRTSSSGSLLSTATALYSIQGFKGFYRGLEANILRAMVLNGTKMSCYDQISLFISHRDTVCKYPVLIQQFIAAFGAGFFMAVTVTPFDLIRTRLMNQSLTGREYNGFVDCVRQIVSKEGPMALYTGFIPIWSRFAPTTTLQLVMFEQMKPLFGVVSSSNSSK